MPTKSRRRLHGFVPPLPLGCAVVAAAACAERASVPPPSPPLAWLGDDTLRVEPLARFFVLAQPVAVDRGVVEEVARHWVHVRSIAALDTVRASDVPDAAVDDVLADSAVSRMRRALRGDPEREAAALVDRVFAEGELRLIAHVLRRVAESGRREDRMLQRRTARSIARDLAEGGTWDEANARSEDLIARAEGGILGLVERGDLPPALDSVAFSLPPDGVSGVVASDAGYHILRRPGLAEARDAFRERLARRIAEEMDLQLADSLGAALLPELHPAAALRIVELARNAWGSLEATDVIGSWAHGTLTAGDVAAHLAALSYRTRAAIADAPASERVALASRLLLRAILRERARTLGYAPAAEDSASARDAVVRTIVRMRGRLGLAGEPPEDPAARSEWASLGVRRYFEALAARRVPLEPLPAPIAVHLARRAGAGGNRAAVDSTIARVRTLLDAAGYPREAPR